VIKIYKTIILPVALMGVKFDVQNRPVTAEVVSVIWLQSYAIIY
jgi:hypothetical protein